MRKFISWRRVSTKMQGRSGLGLAAQLDIVQYWAKEEGGEIIADYEEVYTGTDLAGCRELQKAIAHCKEIGATLIIAKTDRFRSDSEAIQIYNEMGKNIYFCDCPSQDEFMIKLMFLLAAREAKTISIRTSQALQAKIKRGEKLGRPKGCEASEKAVKASVAVRKDKAKANPHNIAFNRELKLWEAKYGTLKSTEDVAAFCDELNSHEFKTANGLPFDVSRTWNTIYKIRKLFSA